MKTNNQGSKFIQKVVFLSGLTILVATGYGVELGETSREVWYPRSIQGSQSQVMSVQAEFQGLPMDQAAQAISQKWGGKVTKQSQVISGKAVTTYTIQKGSESITLQPRFVDGKQQGVVLETGKASPPSLFSYQPALDALKAAQAKGTGPQNSLAMVVREHLPGDSNTNQKFADAMKSNVLRPEHAEMLKSEIPYNLRNQITVSPSQGETVVGMKFGNDFELGNAVKTYAGISYMTHQHGAFDHDKLIGEYSGLASSKIADIRKAKTDSARSNSPYLVRYFLSDPKKPLDPNNFEDFEWFIPSYQDVAYSHARADRTGVMPLKVGGESVVWHVRPFHDNVIQGKYNPGINNNHIVFAITNNKLLEAKFFGKYAPGSMPTTVPLMDVAETGKGISKMIEDLNTRFPKGWVLKSVKEQNTGLFLIHNGRDIEKDFNDYKKSDFDTYRADILKKFAGADEDTIIAHLQEHPNFRGWKIGQYLQNPDTTIAQEKVRINREFRIEAIAGRVLSDGSTVDRHFYKYTDDGIPPKIDPKTLAKVEGFVQHEILDKLPPELRGMPMAMDIAELLDENGKVFDGPGSCTMIESNIGPESGYLIDFPNSLNALHRFLRRYPRLLAEGKVTDKQLTPEQQMAFLNARLKEFKMDPARHFPDYQFLPDRLVTNFPPTEVNPSNFQVDCPEGIASIGKIVRPSLSPFTAGVR